MGAACTLHTSRLLEPHSPGELLLSDQRKAVYFEPGVSARRPFV